MPGIRITRYLPDGYLDAALRQAAQDGLTARPKWLPPWLLYGGEGSDLYEKITRLPVYYPFRLELGLLAAHAADLAAAAQAQTLIELGAGAAEKTRLLLDAMRATGRLAGYVPVDVSERALIGAARRITAAYRGLAVQPVLSDFQVHLGLPAGGHPWCVAFLGSTIGNMTAGERGRFLAALRSQFQPGDTLMLATDLTRDPAKLIPAYHDPAGITAAFIANALVVLNQALAGGDGAGFDVDMFEYVTRWDPDQGWVEMLLRSLQAHEVRLPAIGLTVPFGKGETVRAEISAKFTLGQVAAELDAAGFSLIEWRTDPGGQYGVSLSAVRLRPVPRRKPLRHGAASPSLTATRRRREMARTRNSASRNGPGPGSAAGIRLRRYHRRVRHRGPARGAAGPPAVAGHGRSWIMPETAISASRPPQTDQDSGYRKSCWWQGAARPAAGRSPDTSHTYVSCEIRISLGSHTYVSCEIRMPLGCAHANPRGSARAHHQRNRRLSRCDNPSFAGPGRVLMLNGEGSGEPGGRRLHVRSRRRRAGSLPPGRLRPPGYRRGTCQSSFTDWPGHRGSAREPRCLGVCPGENPRPRGRGSGTGDRREPAPAARPARPFRRASDSSTGGAAGRPRYLRADPPSHRSASPDRASAAARGT